MTEVTVRAVPLESCIVMSEDDRQVPFETSISVSPDLEESKIASSALDIFHSTIPVEYPEHFDFSVWHKGVNLEENSHDVSDKSLSSDNIESTNNKRITELASSVRETLLNLICAEFESVDVVSHALAIFISVIGSRTIPVHVKCKTDPNKEGVVFVYVGSLKRSPRVASKRVPFKHDSSSIKLSDKQFTRIMDRIRLEFDEIKANPNPY